MHSGGIGGGGPMWLARLEKGQPVLIASPKVNFSGWLYSVLPSNNYGYRDIVLGWQLSAADTTLKYFKFNGRQYSCVDTAEAQCDDNGCRIAYDSLQ